MALKFERYDDAVYAHTDYVRWYREHGVELAPGWVRDRSEKHGRATAVPSAYAFTHALLDAIDTDILWMSTEMMDLTQVAMEDFDPTEKVTMDDIFIPAGFLVLPHAFLSKDISGHTLAWRILYWRAVEHMVTWTNDQEYTYDLSQSGEPEGGIRFMEVSYIGDPDDWGYANPDAVEGLKQSGLNWGIAHATAIPFSLVHMQGDDNDRPDYPQSWLQFWRVAQKLMSERIVTKEHVTPGRPARREAKRFLLPPPILRVIELRRPREEHHGEQENGNGDRRYSHRWIVRGHWHTYHYKTGPKQKYVGAYVKGPADLELIVKQRVWNWDR